MRSRTQRIVFITPHVICRSIHEVDVEKKIGRLLYATSSLLWEEEYDATKESTISWDVPCAELIKELQLRQLELDGFYYDRNDKLAAFDVRLTQKHSRVVIRKDLLDCFLSKTGLELVWLVDSEKEIHAPDRSIAQRSEWEGVFTYQKKSIRGEIYRVP